MYPQQLNNYILKQQFIAFGTKMYIYKEEHSAAHVF